MSDQNYGCNKYRWDQENEEQTINSAQRDGFGDVVTKFPANIKRKVYGEDLFGYGLNVFGSEFSGDKDVFGDSNASDRHQQIGTRFDISE